MSAASTLIIMRHGKADPSSPTGRDHDRPLLPIGVENTGYCATILERLVDVPLRVVSSEYVRARQTAATLLATWGRPASDVIIDASFNSDRSLDGMVDAIRGYVDAPTVIVSHMPQVAELVDVITAANATSLLFKPGAFAVLRLEHPARLRADLAAFLTPSMVRRVLQVP